MSYNGNFKTWNMIACWMAKEKNDIYFLLRFCHVYVTWHQPMKRINLLRKKSKTSSSRHHQQKYKTDLHHKKIFQKNHYRVDCNPINRQKIKQDFIKRIAPSSKFYTSKVNLLENSHEPSNIYLYLIVNTNFNGMFLT